MDVLQDSFGRVINSLRISITDRCNLRCLYCMPSNGVKLTPKENILTFEEVLRIVRVGARLGINKVKLTGGEPLVRQGMVDLVRKISETDGIEDLSLTTNGLLLEEKASELFQAGLKRLNMSLDSLRVERFAQLTRGGKLTKALAGLDKALEVGLNIKINVVALNGFNDSEILDFVLFAQEKKVEVRFIEFMPLCGSFWNRNLFLPLSELKSQIEKHFELTPIDSDGTAQVYETNQGTRVGFIPTLSDPFCSTCSRLRLTAGGSLRPCLFSSREIHILPMLRMLAPDGRIIEAFQRAVCFKPEFNPCLAGEERFENILVRNIGG